MIAASAADNSMGGGQTRGRMGGLLLSVLPFRFSVDPQQTTRLLPPSILHSPYSTGALAAAAARPAPRTAQSRTSLLLGHQLPMPLGDDVDSAVHHLYGGLIVNQIRWNTHLGGPFLQFGHGILGERGVIQVRRYRKIDQPQGFVATGGRKPADELLPDGGGQHHTPGAPPDVDRFGPQRGEEVLQAGLPHPGGEIQSIAAFAEQSGCLLEQRGP